MTIARLPPNPRRALTNDDLHEAVHFGFASITRKQVERLTRANYSYLRHWLRPGDERGGLFYQDVN